MSQNSAWFAQSECASGVPRFTVSFQSMTDQAMEFKSQAMIWPQVPGEFTAGFGAGASAWSILCMSRNLEARLRQGYKINWMYLGMAHKLVKLSFFFFSFPLSLCLFLPGSQNLAWTFIKTVWVSGLSQSFRMRQISQGLWFHSKHFIEL